MGDVSAEPSMEEILSSIKRIIADDSEAASVVRSRRRPIVLPVAAEAPVDREEDVLELNQPMSESEETVPAAPETASVSADVPAPEPILSSQAAEASRARLDSLSRLIVKPEVAGSDTLEGMVRDMLKPMLRDWLDTNLPELVERLVAREISRISSQS